MTDIEVVCPKCGSKDVFKFEKDIYIVKDKEFYKKHFYGCNKCSAGFVIMSETSLALNTGPQVDLNKVQGVLGNLSKSCFNVLGNIK